jgi:hypothetical protein
MKMAEILTQPGRMVFKKDGGGSASLAGIKASATAEGLAGVALAIEGLLAADVESVSIQRSEILDYKS